MNLEMKVGTNGQAAFANTSDYSTRLNAVAFPHGK